jgi:cysteine desulfurase
MASHVLIAMGLSASLAGSAVRFSLGLGTTADEIERAATIVGQVIERISPTARRQEKLQGAAV